MFPYQRIVCLTEETVETLYLLGEQDRIVGISGYVVRPPQARRQKPRVSAFTTADIGKILALDTPAALKQSIGADTVVTVKATGDTGQLAELLAREVEGVTRTRRLDGGVELHVQGGDRLVPRIVMAAERGGFDLVDLSVSEPSLETVFINLTGKELRD